MYCRQPVYCTTLTVNNDSEIRVDNTADVQTASEKQEVLTAVLSTLSTLWIVYMLCVRITNNIPQNEWNQKYFGAYANFC